MPMVRKRKKPLSSSSRLLYALPIAVLPGCLQFFPEASLKSDGGIAGELPRIETALGADYLAEPIREVRPAAEIFARAREGVLERPTAGTGLFEQRVYSMFRAATEPRSPASAAAAPGTRAAPYAYDVETERVLAPDFAPPAEDPRAARQHDLARTEALARALLCQRYTVEDLSAKKRAARKMFSRDELEGKIGGVTGAAQAGVIDASLSPIAAFDAGAQPIRRYHRALVERLLEDPDGAPARELARSDVPDAIRRQLETLLETSGVERRRMILRVFAATQLYLEARDRLTPSNLKAVYDQPPASSEQLMHPERYLDYDDPPVAITEGRRAGLLGFAHGVEATEVAGEFGIYNALEGALTPREAARAAAGWGGDLLTVYRERETGGLAYAWSIDCDDRFAARRLCDALARSAAITQGGVIEEIEDDLFELRDGAVPCRIQRNGSRIAFVLGGRDEMQRIALDQLMLEVAKRGEATSLAANHDDLYRLTRAVASPFFFDRPGRFDSHAYSLYGWGFRSRRAMLDGEFEALNWSEFPLAHYWLPVDLYGFFFTRERGELRRDLSLFQQGIRTWSDYGRDRHRVWTPFVSWTRSPEYRQTGVLLGFLFEMGEGAGRSEMSPRPVYSRATELDGARTKTGVVFDAVSHASREGVGTRTELFPYGALGAFERRVAPDGFSLGVFLDAIQMRRVKTLPDRPSFDFSLFWKRGFRFFSDDASQAREISFLRGWFAGHFAEPRRHGTGLVRVGSRWFFGFGAEDGRGYFDFCWFRVGG